MKKPELYTQQRRYGNDDIRVPINPNKIAVWNQVYYRSKGRRKAYVIKERKPSVRAMYGGREYRYTRWQLDHDLAKPWHVSCTWPRDFATFNEAITYAHSKEAKLGPFKYHLNDPIIQQAMIPESWSPEVVE